MLLTATQDKLLQSKLIPIPSFDLRQHEDIFGDISFIANGAQFRNQ